MNVRRALLMVAAMVLAGAAAWGQPSTVPDGDPWAHPELWGPAVRPDLWVEIQDSVYRLRVIPHNDTIALSNPDTMPRRWYSAAYEYTMVYDPLGRTNYMFTECRRNGERIHLEHWQSRRIVHTADDVLGFNSRTAAFPLVPGDTITFCRELKWVNPTTRIRDTNNYYSLDTLDFAVELVGARDSLRRALLDSIGVLAQPEPGAPVIYGMRPLMAKVAYVVPASMPGDSAFVRVRVYARGDGAYNFVRRDAVTIGFEDLLNLPSTINYLNIYSRVFSKLRLENQGVPHPSDARLAVIQSHGTTNAEIRFSSNPDGGETSLAVYDITGHLIFSPYSSTESSGEQHVQYHFPAHGTYVIALYHNGTLVKTSNVNI
ncbi:MAG: hypothetical protein JST22_10315 [Bacteroidetes bacterium]|nr:hypothetical protein [Bacteroidota bacterium]